MSFDDHTEIVTDLFEDDFNFKQTLKTKTKTPMGVGVTTEITRAPAKGEAAASLDGKVTLKHKFDSFSVDKLQMKSDGRLVCETSVENFVADGLKFTFSADDFYTGDLGVEYSNDTLAVQGEVDVVELQSANISATARPLGAGDGLVVGAGATAQLPGKDPASISAYHLGVAHSTDKYAAAVRTDNLSEHNAYLMYNCSPDIRVGVVLGCKPKDSAYIGGMALQYQCNPLTTVRARGGTDGAIAVAASHNLADQVNVTGALETSVSDLSSFKWGVGVTLG